MRQILACSLALTLMAPAAAAAAQPPASGRVVGATVAVSGVPAPAPERARVAAVAEPAAAPAAAADRPVAHAAAGATVAIRDFSFGPATIAVHVGDTVTWSNAGPTPHTATANDGSFDTGTLKAGQSGSHTFASAGTFVYHCTLHPFMRATVQVTAVASGGGTSAPPPTQAAATPSASRGPTLPRTGLSAPGLAGLGALMLLCGVLLRALTRPT